MHLFGFYFPFDHARRTSESPRSALGAKKCSPCAKPNENLNFSKLLETAPPMLFSDHSTLLFNQLCSSYIFRACLTSELRTTPLYLVAKPTRLQHLSLSHSLALSLSPSLTLSLSLALVLWRDPWFGCHLSWIFFAMETQ